MFVTLKQEASDYSSDFREAMGRCVIEVRSGKGKFSAYIQGLKKGGYSLLFISCKNGNNVGVEMGSIFADFSGKGEFKLEFDPENVCGSRLKIEDFHAVAIMPFGNTSIKALLVGYVAGVVQWKEGFSVFKQKDFLSDNTDSKKENNDNIKKVAEKETAENALSEISEEETAESILSEISEEETAESVSDEISEKEMTESVSDEISEKEMAESVLDEVSEKKVAESVSSEATENNNAFGIEKQGNIVFDESIQENEEVNDIGEERPVFETLNKAGENFSDIIKKFKRGIERIEEQRKVQKKAYIKDDFNCSENFDNYIDKNISNEDIGKTKSNDRDIDYIFENNAKMEPFQNKKNDILWVRIDLSEMVILPGRMWVYINNPFVSFSEKKYKHLILGKSNKGENQNYILGVPGRYFSNYRLEAGLQGFKRFECCENKLPSDGDYGYWLMNIPTVGP